MSSTFSCIVVGSGHAGSCAALAAVEAGCKRVLMLEKAPEAWVGGNGYFTAGAHRTVHGGLQDLLPLVCNASPEMTGKIDIEPYTKEDFTSDIMRLGDNQSNPALVRAVVDNSRDAVQWLHDRVKVPFTLAYNRQAYNVGGREKFWGGLALSVDGGGKGLIAAHQRALVEAGVEIWFDSPVVELLHEEGRVTGVVVRSEGVDVRLASSSVILAAGGFESSPEMREKFLGPGWQNVRVRGTPYNTGDGFVLAEFVNAQTCGDWAGCHSTTWDANASSSAGDRELTNQFTKSAYPLGIMLNSQGERFVDEGEDYRNYTYAKFGRAILAQPGSYAFQIFDSKVLRWMREEEYGDGVVEKVTADNLNTLAEILVAEKGLIAKLQFLRTISAFNLAVQCNRVENPDHQDATYNPSIKDGLSTANKTIPLLVPKSNWALRIDSGPFLAVKVACGVTFTFGGLSIDPQTAGVLSRTGTVIPGLFCTGEMVGGLFYRNYPGGSGLTAGCVFGRKAGREAAECSI